MYNDKVYTESRETALDDNDNNEEVVLSEFLPQIVPICDAFSSAHRCYERYTKKIYVNKVFGG